MGFPAHAGMDRTSTWRGICSRRFPRPRGDGPMPRTLGVTDPAVSPPTRGWTPSAESLVPRVPGFPAHAGMDPRCRPSTRSASRFPRPRGDGPKAFTATQAGTGVSPPTRGWTRTRPGPWCGVVGFPAHAGMDPPWGPEDRLLSGFPRPRGDGPEDMVLAWITEAVSPPTRGWTRPRWCRHRHRYGFPAHAGMDPAMPRGLVSPPTRGWTPHGSATGAPGFPAHAGMDPSS